jgi:hypothetical protein
MKSAFAGVPQAWVIVTKDQKPLLDAAQLPMFWNRAVARQHFKPWMREHGCRIVRAFVLVRTPGSDTLAKSVRLAHPRD